MTKILFTLVLSGWLLSFSQTAFAYIGPGAGLSAIGTLIALIGAVLLAIIGFAWYPLKRLLRNRRKAKTDANDTENDSQ